MNKNTINKAAAVIVGGCGIYVALSLITGVILIVGGFFIFSSCTANQKEKMEKAEKLLSRVTESDMPDTLELTDGVKLEKLFATQYLPIDGKYDTVILKNYKYTTGMFSASCNIIAVDYEGNAITEDYYCDITYDYHGYAPEGETQFLACDDFNEITFIAPDGKIICTLSDEELEDCTTAAKKTESSRGSIEAVSGETVCQHGEIYYTVSDNENGFSVYTVYAPDNN